jgi:RNA polymerase-binding transcription factor DksA
MKADPATYRLPLTALRDRLLAEVSGLGEEALRRPDEASGNLSHTPLHLADLGTDASEQVLALSLLAREQDILQQVLDALTRIEDGTFGFCTTCCRAIPEERLAALPYARSCIDCARKSEREADNGNSRAAAF